MDGELQEGDGSTDEFLANFRRVRDLFFASGPDVFAYAVLWDPDASVKLPCAKQAVDIKHALGCNSKELFGAVVE